ncbi:MAG: SRPBCC family protein [Planctomycetes bacterium]|nr:SRPBCC family protein [Planctomycetota bacterium]
MATSTTQTFFKTMVLAFAGMILVYYGVGQVLAKDWKVETKRTLNAKPEQVGALVHDLKTWERWCLTKAELGPQTQRTIEGEAGKVGHRVVWTGPMGKVMLEFAGTTPNSIDYRIGFEAPAKDGVVAPPMQNAKGHVEWAAVAAGTEVTWRDSSEHAGLPGRWIGWFGAHQQRVEQIQSSSLQSLQAEIDKGTAPVPAVGPAQPTTK